ncbi:caspase family protein [Candidatus Woesearchaeota archaeon]|nr:caspase family protein [Candidatus Woesearchaeota archaeon]
MKLKTIFYGFLDLLAVTSLAYVIHSKTDWDKNRYNIIETVKPTIATTVKKERPKSGYAILITGSGDIPQDSITTAYDALHSLGYTKEKIVVFVPKSKKEKSNIADFVTEKSVIEQEFKEIANKITNDEDFVFVYNGHSDGEELQIDGQNITADGLEKLLSVIKAGRKILVFDTCHSGAFSEKYGKDNIIAISTSKKNKSSSKSSKFLELLFSALKDNTIADKNNDGKTSLEEAFVYAAENGSMQKGFFSLFRQVPNLQYQKINPNEVYLK